MPVKTLISLPSSDLGSRFLRLWGASALSGLSDGVTLVAAPLLAAALTRDPALVAGLAFAQRLPWLLFALPSGALVDRLDRRGVIGWVNAGSALLIAALGLATLLDLATLPLLYAVFFVLAAGETLADTAEVAILPAVVPRDDLARANARLAGTLTVTNQFAGPPLGGFLFALAAAVPFLFGAGGLAAAAALILALRGDFRVARAASAPPADLRWEIGEGVRWLWGHQLLRTLALTLALLNITLVAQVSITVLFARERLGLGATGYGLLVASYGVGGVLGSLIADRIIARLGASRELRLAVVVETVAPALIALSHSPVGVGVIFLLFGGHAVVWGALLTTLRQELTPPRLRGRVESAHRLLEYGGAAPGALLGGLLATRCGLAAPFWLGAATGVILIPLVWGVFSEDSVTSARHEARNARDARA